MQARKNIGLILASQIYKEVTIIPDINEHYNFFPKLL